MPEEAGFGITTWPLYSGLVRSAQLAGFGSPFASASMVLKQSAEDHTSMPTQLGGVGGIAHQRLDVGEPGRRIGHQHALLLQQHQRGRGQAHHHVGLRIALLRQKLGGDDPGRVTHPLDIDVGIGGLEGRLVGLQLVGLERGIDEKLRRGCGRRRKRDNRREPDGRGADFMGHFAVPVVEEVCSLG